MEEVILGGLILKYLTPAIGQQSDALVAAHQQLLVLSSVLDHRYDLVEVTADLQVSAALTLIVTSDVAVRMRKAWRSHRVQFDPGRMRVSTITAQEAYISRK